ncbi:MAG: ABC transporter permease subunit, partial [Candidatus Dormibacteraceae bacterium]
MISALTYEWRRITSIRSTWILLGIIIILPVTVITIGLLLGQSVDPLSTTIFSLSAVGFLAAALGAQSLGQEYRFGTIRVTLTTYPTRLFIFVAKLVVALGFTVVTGVVTIGLCLLIASLAGDPWQLTADALAIAFRMVLILAGWLLIGFGIAGLTRNTMLGIVLPLVTVFVIEPLLLLTVIPKALWLAELLPFNGNNALATGWQAWRHLG